MPARGVAGRRGPHAQPSPRPAHQVRHRRAPRDRAQAIAGLRALAAGRAGPGRGRCRTTGRAGRARCSCIPGQGSHWAGMGRRLLADEPAFAAAIAELEPDFVEQVGFSLHQVIAAGEPVSGDAQVQPVLVGLQLALTELWRSYGVHPDAVIGHSMGEVTAAVVAGALSPADGLRVIAIRSPVDVPAGRAGRDGAARTWTPRPPRALIADHPGVEVAVMLSPRQTVIAGPPDTGRRGDRGGDRAEPIRPPHQHGCRLAHRARWIRSCPNCGRH